MQSIPLRGHAAPCNGLAQRRALVTIEHDELKGRRAAQNIDDRGGADELDAAGRVGEREGELASERVDLVGVADEEEDMRGA